LVQIFAGRAGVERPGKRCVQDDKNKQSGIADFM